MTFFTIVIPTYNSIATIQRALNSVLIQSFPDFEILVIDGMSNDNTVEEVRSFQDKRIRIFSEKDKGVYDAMNKGVGKAIGKWIYFLGSDDYLFDKQVLLNVKNRIYNSKLDVLYGNVTSPKLGDIYDGFFSRKKIKQKNICHQSIFFNRKVFNDLRGFNLLFPVLADWEFNIRWLLSSKFSHEYYDIIIAYFEDGGISSKQEDINFNILFKWKYFVYDSEIKFISKIYFFCTFSYKLIKEGFGSLILEMFRDLKNQVSFL